MGKRFKGVYNLYKKELYLFTPGRESRRRQGRVITDLSAALLDEMLGSQARDLREDIEFIEGVAAPFELDHYLKGNQTPVFFSGVPSTISV